MLPNSSKEIDFKKFDWLVTFFSELSLDKLFCIDANIIFFISGYVGRSVSQRRKCLFCKEMLVKGHDPTAIYNFLPEEYTHLFDIADRGDLSTPLEFCYTVTALAVQYYLALTDNDHARIRFLTLSNQREAFIFALKKALPFQNCSLLLQRSAGHLNFTAIIESAFNCFAKNEPKRINVSKETNLEERKKILENCKNFLLTVSLNLILLNSEITELFVDFD